MTTTKTPKRCGALALRCPFCNNKVVKHPNPEFEKQYYVCWHEKWCWLYKPLFTLIPIAVVKTWNRRTRK